MISPLYISQQSGWIGRSCRPVYINLFCCCCVPREPNCRQGHPPPSATDSGNDDHRHLFDTINHQFYLIYPFFLRLEGSRTLTADDAKRKGRTSRRQTMSRYETRGGKPHLDEFSVAAASVLLFFSISWNYDKHDIAGQRHTKWSHQFVAILHSGTKRRSMMHRRFNSLLLRRSLSCSLLFYCCTADKITSKLCYWYLARFEAKQRVEVVRVVLLFSKLLKRERRLINGVIGAEEEELWSSSMPSQVKTIVQFNNNNKIAFAPDNWIRISSTIEEWLQPIRGFIN